MFALEILVCPDCGGTRRLLAAIHDPDSIRRVLTSPSVPVGLGPSLVFLRADARRRRQDAVGRDPEELQPLQTEHKTAGFVWVYLRKPVTKTSANERQD